MKRIGRILPETSDPSFVEKLARLANKARTRPAHRSESGRAEFCGDGSGTEDARPSPAGEARGVNRGAPGSETGKMAEPKPGQVGEFQTEGENRSAKSRRSGSHSDHPSRHMRPAAQSAPKRAPIAQVAGSICLFGEKGHAQTPEIRQKTHTIPPTPAAIATNGSAIIAPTAARLNTSENAARTNAPMRSKNALISTPPASQPHGLGFRVHR